MVGTAKEAAAVTTESGGVATTGDETAATAGDETAATVGSNVRPGRPVGCASILVSNRFSMPPGSWITGSCYLASRISYFS